MVLISKVYLPSRRCPSALSKHLAPFRIHTDVSQINEDAIAENLRKRLMDDLIYTWIGAQARPAHLALPHAHLI